MAGDQRFAISARIIGAVHRDSPKLKMFMVSVLWSDDTEVVVYRSFQDFKSFHRQLKKRFPHMNPFRKNNRVIPKFSGESRRSSLKQKGPRRSVQRMKFLESYCDQLLRCDQSVTRSAEVTQFFVPRDQDLQPDFTRNSIMILLSDDGGTGAQHAGGGGGGVTHPFVTQTYRCVAAYETKDAKNRPFKVAVDEKLDVLIKDPAGWWLVENEDRRLAWFPAPYLELWDGEEEEEEEEAGLQLGGALYCAVRSYVTKKDDEVSVPIGSVVEVLRKSDDGWWLIRFNGKGGYIPSMYLQPYSNPRAGLYSLQRKLHSSTLNLATGREPRASPPPSTGEENSPQRDSAGPSRGEPSAPRRLHKARSLDVLSETWTQPQAEREPSDSRARSMSNTSNTSNTSNVLSFSGLSSSSDSSSSLKEDGQHQRHQPDVRRDSNTSSGSSGSVTSQGSETASVAPRVPPRPKTEEILTRCTTMTRKAALSTKTRLQIQSIHSR